MRTFVAFNYKSGRRPCIWCFLLVASLFCSGCGEAIFPMGPEPTARALITIVEPPIGATRIAAFGQPVTTRVTTSQPYKTIQGEVIYPAGGVAGGSMLPPAAPGMYYWSSYGVSFVATQSGIYRHEYLSANAYGIDLATGLFTILLNHSLKPGTDPHEVCKEDECEDTTPPPPGIPGVTYNPEWLTPDPYLSEEIGSGLSEQDLHDIAQQASTEFLEYTADQYGDVVEDWLVENGYLTAALDVQLSVSERIDRYINIIEQLDHDVVPGFSSNRDVVRILRALQDKLADVPREAPVSDGMHKRSVIEEHYGADMEVFPNPSPDRVHIGWRDGIGTEGVIRVFDSSGQLVHQSTLSQGARYYDWDGTSDAGRAVPSGRYFLSVHSGRQVITGSVTVIR